jgi:hypothetical protein
VKLTSHFAGIGGPLLGMDDAMVNTGLFYARFLDDWVVLAPTRPPLKAAIKHANQVLEAHNVDKHPDKRVSGRSPRV